MSNANRRQVGGLHYKADTQGAEEHWDRIYRLFGPGYFIGSITKYVERYQKKNGIEDLAKARHFIDKLIELEEAKANAGLKLGSPGLSAPVRNYPGDGSVAGPGYLEQSLDPHEVERANARFQGS